MERLVASQDYSDPGPSYGMVGHDMERRGRTKSFVATGIAALVLFPLQTLPWLVAVGWLPSRVTLEPLISPRLSLLFDFLFLVALTFHATRACELVWMDSRWLRSEGPDGEPVDRRHSTTFRLTNVLFGVLLAGVGLDIAENVWLWAFAGPDRASDMFVPLVTPLVWVLLTIGMLGLWCMVAVAVPSDPPLPEPGADPHSRAVVPPPLSGTVITCSGGGIRSTSFCLGGLQVLADRGIYDEARYVVGVSGGGYIAAAMHIVRGRAGFARLDPPAFADSSPEEAWLRRNTRFLLESARVAALGGMSLLYGIAVNLFLVTGVMVFVAWWLGWFFAASGGLMAWNTPHATAAHYTGAWRWITWTALLPIAAMVTFMLADAVDRLCRMPGALRRSARVLCVLMLVLGAGAILVLFVVPWLLVTAHNYAAGSGSALARLITAAGLIPSDVCDQLVSSGHEACGSSGGPSVAGASLVSFATILAAVVAVLRSARRFLPDAAGPNVDAGALRRLVDRAVLRLLPWAALVVIVLAVATLLLRWTTALVADPTLLGHWGWFYLVGAGFFVLKISTDANRTSLHYFYRERLSQAFVLERTPMGIRPVDYSEQLRFSDFRPPPGDGPELIACASANVSDNEVVPADRNCVPFNFGHQTTGLAGDLFPAEARTESRLFEFHADHAYRVATIPAAMAISGAAFSPLAGRFTRRMAPYRVVMALANARLGVWLPNPLWIEDARVFRRLVKLRLATEVQRFLAELGDAVATADIQLDRLSPRDLVWLRSLELDPEAHDVVHAVRFPTGKPIPDLEAASPRRRRYVWHKRARALLYRPGAFRLAKEAFGKTSVYDRFLYVTDGGHYDNLGLVEALRHRPKKIYVLDASSDPEDSFSTLGQAIATARMDLGCELDLDPRRLRRKNDKPPLVSYDTGKVRYPDGEEAELYYVKAIVTRKLPWDVEAYAKEHATFPRTSTTNQLYGEFDLEAYRVLGREGTRALLDAPTRKFGAGAGSSSNGRPPTTSPAPSTSGDITADQLAVGEVR